MSIYWLSLIPFVLWFIGILLQRDKLNSRPTQYLLLLAGVLSLVTGIVLYRYQAFPEKRGFFVAAFGIPLVWEGCFELFRIIYRWLRHENPCINVRSGRWLGDRPVDGFYTTYPPEKVISGADVIFGLSQMAIPLLLTMALLIVGGINW